MLYQLKSQIKKKLITVLINLFNWSIGKLHIDNRDFSKTSSSDKNAIARLILILVNVFKIQKGDFTYFDKFEFWEKNDFHLIPDHFYQPLPNVTSLKHHDFNKKSAMIGINMNEITQLHFLKDIFPKFKAEYKKFPHKPTNNEYEFHFGNGAFDGIDALVLYCMIRYFKPKTVVEVGSGWSTRIAAKAALRNKQTSLISIEPYPYDFLKKGFPGLTEQIPKQIQKVDLSFFNKLDGNDILFIDSSHTVKIAGDVNYLILDVLPRLKKGVIVHVHDIFLPYEYPKEWVMKEYRFWNEQYLFQAFLIDNHEFEIIFANNYMGSRYKKTLKQIFPRSPFHSGGSIWIRKI